MTNETVIKNKLSERLVCQRRSFPRSLLADDATRHEDEVRPEERSMLDDDAKSIIKQ